MKKYKIHQHVMIKTRYTIRFFDLSNPRAQEIDAELNELINENEEIVEPTHYQALIAELNKLCPVRQYEATNLVVGDGREVLAMLLAGETDYTGEITRGALGTDDTEPDASDSKLGAEVARKGFGTRNRSGTTIDLDFYYSKSDTDGTYEEFGLFIDGTDTADSGQLFSRLLTGGWTKTSIEAMTVSVQIDVNSD